MKTLQVVRAGLAAIRDLKRTHAVQSATEKSIGDFAHTEDFSSDAAIVKMAEKLYPNLTIFSEESCELPDQLPANCLVNDPLDGSNNRGRKRSAWGVASALIQDRTPVEASAFIRLHHRSYFLRAKKGEGLFVCQRGKDWKRVFLGQNLPGVRLSVPGSPKMQRFGAAKVYQDYLTSNNLWLTTTAEGCALANVMALILGYTDVYVNAATGNVLDLAHVQLFIEEARGFVSDEFGKPVVWNVPWQPVILARNRKVAEPFIMMPS